MTKEERYDALQEKLDFFEECLDYAQSLFELLDVSEISGVKGLLDKTYSIVEALEYKIERTTEYQENIDY